MLDINQVAGALFAIAIGVGISMLTLRILKVQFPKALAFVHLGFGGTGLVLLLIGMLQGSPVLWPFIILVLAAGGGFTLFLVFHARNRPLPVPLILGHGAVGLTAFIWLLLRYLAME